MNEQPGEDLYAAWFTSSERKRTLLDNTLKRYGAKHFTSRGPSPTLPASGGGYADYHAASRKAKAQTSQAESTKTESTADNDPAHTIRSS